MWGSHENTIAVHILYGIPTGLGEPIGVVGPTYGLECYMRIYGANRLQHVQHVAEQAATKSENIWVRALRTLEH